MFANDYANILALVNLVLSLPASSAEAERGFSAMKMTKTDWRSCLKDDALSDLLTVKLESAPILPVKSDQGEVLVPAFDADKAIMVWLNMKNRRVKDCPSSSSSGLSDPAGDDVDARDSGDSGEVAVASEDSGEVEVASEDSGEVEVAGVVAGITDTDYDHGIGTDDECYYSDEDLLVDKDTLQREEAVMYKDFMSYDVVFDNDSIEY